MKTFNWTMTLLFAGLLALAGCGKEKPRAPVQQGVAIDLLGDLGDHFLLRLGDARGGAEVTEQIKQVASKNTSPPAR